MKISEKSLEELLKDYTNVYNFNEQSSQTLVKKFILMIIKKKYNLDKDDIIKQYPEYFL